MERLLTVSIDDFHNTIDDHVSRGFRLLMLRPADSPSEALLQKPDREGGLNIRLVSHPGDKNPDDSQLLAHDHACSNGEWTIGRAGMMYRDLLPTRLGGKLIASHIRILNEGPVPDRVHYHKIDFQVIYCLKGAIKVAYEDQGEPFRLKPGDCVLQPPEIRHRVLEAEAGSEVIEITSPAEHETWFDDELELPTGVELPERRFAGQQFAMHRDGDSVWDQLANGLEEAITKIGSAGQNAPQVTVLQSQEFTDHLINVSNNNEVTIVIGGRGMRLKFS